MAFLSASAVSLRYPLYSRTSAGASRVGAETVRVERNAKGQPIAVNALRNISLRATSGDRVAIIGRNGSGKTSLLHVVAGLLPPDSGVIETQGWVTSLININLGMQMQATGHRNITLRGLASGLKKSEIEALRPAIAEFSELGDFLDLPVETYSSGMRMRLSFAVATVLEPEILVLDEWLSTGDAAFRTKAAERMKAFADQASIMFLASHNERLVKSTCNRAIWLVDGSVEMDGGADEVWGAYAKESRKTRT